MDSPLPGTVVIYGPFYARTGFGLLARGWAMALHQAGVPVRIVPLDCNDPQASGDLDDCDLYLLHSLQYTPLAPPVTAIFAYVPTYAWPKLALPEPHLRIMLTTFDSSANAATPPARLIYICNQMDQVWVANRTEAEAWVHGGLEATRVRAFNWPHEWIDNPKLGPPQPRQRPPGEPFRFLHVSLFLPRRRLDVLLRAFFEEFPRAGEAELYLKMSYPSWHPVGGKPKKDLHALIERVRRLTRSKAAVRVDETLGTRLALAQLMDSCDTYVSTDTTHTAPVTEALIRHRPAIITDGWGVDLPPQVWVIPNSAERIAITPEMAEYMPHQRGTSFPALDVNLVRRTLRRLHDLSAEERDALARAGAEYLRERYSYAATAPAAIAAIREGWEEKQRGAVNGNRPLPEPSLCSSRREEAQTSRSEEDQSFLTSAATGFKAPTRGQETVEALPEPCPFTPSLSPDGGEGVRGMEATAARLADPNAPTRTSKPLNVHWCGLQLFHGKVPKANREICLELMRRGHQLSLAPGNGPFHIEELELDDSPKFRQLAARFYEPLTGPADVSVSSRWHPVFHEQSAPVQILANTWWSGAIPVDWVKPIAESVSEVWVPSRHVRDNFRAGGVAAGQLQVIPPGVDPAVFRPDAPRFPLQTRKRFKFLFVGETSPRKGFDLLLGAYLRLFRRGDDVCLVVKDVNCEDYYARLAARDLIRRCQADARAPEIEYVDRMLGEEALAGLYAACDCFVQPHRVSSFSLAALEAMACGLPVITTKHGGALEFCDDQTAFLLPAREIRRRPSHVGHWRVSGEQVHAEPDVRALQERLEHVCRHPDEAARHAQAGAERVRREFTWTQTVDRIEQRFAALPTAAPDVSWTTGKSPLPSRVETRSSASPQIRAQAGGPTVVLFAPFYNRSGYGVAGRALASALHGAGVRLRLVPVNEAEPGIDDCDLDWLRALEQTPVSAPVVAIFFHVPGQAWLDVKLPPPSLRIMFTTFDSSAQGNRPPAEWVSVCRQMDQVWLQTRREADVFAAAGVPFGKIKMLSCPHPWIHNPLLPAPAAGAKAAGQPFRFLSVAMFQPRRRWDTLLEAFLTEFKDLSAQAGPPGVELYLKVNYPSWHPVPGQPQKDLCELIASLRRRTGSNAPIVVDESLDTRLGICRLLDSCDAYVSTDTSITAPVGEAFVRRKVAVIPDGYGAALPYCEGALVIPVDSSFTRPMTDAELLYQPHHRDRPMPLLRVEDVRRALRCAFELPEAQRQEMGRRASLVMECAYGHAVVVPALLKAIQAGLEEKFSRKPATAQTQRDDSPPAPASAAALAVSWEGTFLDFGSLSHVNREITRQLECDGRLQLARVNLAPPLRPETIPAPFQETARRLASRPPADARVTVRHAWPPNWTPPARGAWVLVQPWEFGAVPAEWVRNSGRVDEIWVPSRCARQMYVDSGVAPEKVHVVPNGIDPAVFRPDAPPLALPTEKSFKFLFVGGTIRRKGPDALLRAYGEHFTAADDVCLVIKDFGGKDVYAGQTFAAEIQAAQARPGAPEILYLTDDLPDIAGLYTACDCLVHPYRGEGFGLPVLEAMACGLPVVVTAGGATDDFATDDFAYRIASRRVSLGREVGGMPLAAEGWWLEPSLAELGSAMQQVWQQREEARAKGRAASEHARREWTWERAARVAADRLQGLAAKTTARPARKAAPIELPPVAKLGHLGPAHELFRQKKWIEAWNAVLAALQVRPFHPEACLLLAEIAQAAGDFTRARQLAQYAQKMAPKWKPIRQFLKALPPRSAGTRFALPAQPDRSRSTPLGGRLTVCLITKNEEQFLGQCLASVRDLADQIVVMDTGSTDWTMDIARRYGAEVHQCEWTDDFSAARNAALEHATGDWVLVLDADEELRAGDQAALRKMLQDEGAIGWRLPIVDVGREEEGHSYVPRLFRNAPGLFFVGRVHEQIFSSVEVRRQEWGLENRLGQATLLHHGYTKELTLQRNKVERNLRLLERAVAELPGEPNLLMNYGLELARAGRRDEGIRRYWEAFDEISALPPAQVAPELRETLLTQLCSHLLGVKDWPGVVRALTGPLAKRGGLTASLHFALGLAWMEQRRWSDAAEQFRLCLSKRHQPALSPINKEVLRAGPHHCLALCLKALRRPDDAARAFAAALKDDPRSRPARCDYALFLSEQGQPVEALKLLHQLIGEQADDPAAWLLGGQIALSQPEFLEFARDWTGEAVKHLPAHPRLIAQRAEALLLSQQPAEALACWRLLPPDAGTRALAGRLICELLGDAEGAVPPAAEPAVSQEFLQWYRALVRFGARDTIDRLNHQLDRLRDLLPTAVGVLERALAEAAQPAAA